MTGGPALGGGDAPPQRPAYRDGTVLRWLAAHTATMVGEGVYFLALAWAAREVAGPATVGVVLMVGALPRAVLMLAGGVLADRFGPRPVVLGSDAVRCVVILGLAAALALGSPGLVPLVAVALAFGAVDALFLPAVGALPPYLAPPGQLARVQGMRMLSMRAGNTVGPPVGGAAMAVGGPAAAFAVAGAMFALSLPLLYALRLRPGPDDSGGPEGAEPAGRPGAWGDLRRGLRYLVRHPLVGPVVLTALLLDLTLNGPLNVGLVLLADTRGWGPGGMAWVVSAFGLGAAAGALLLALRGRLPRAGPLALVSTAAAAAGVGAIGLAGSLALAVAASGAAGVCAGVGGGLATALVQTATAPAYLGRVMAVLALGAFGLPPLTFPLIGAAVGQWGPEPVYAACGLLGMAGSAVGAAAPAYRHARLPRTPDGRDAANAGDGAAPPS